MLQILSFFFFNDTATTEIYTLSLHDALPICRLQAPAVDVFAFRGSLCGQLRPAAWRAGHHGTDRKSTRLNSSHTVISYAVFCLKKKITQAAPTSQHFTNNQLKEK